MYYILANIDNNREKLNCPQEFEPLYWSNLVLWTTDTEEPLKRYKDGGGDGDVEIDLGERKEEGDDVWEDVELKVQREAWGGEDEK